MWPEGPVPQALSQYTGYLLSRLGEASARRFREALEPEGLHPRDFGVMSVVAAHPGSSQQQLHALTGIDTSSMVAVIDELEARGLAARRPHPEDRRVRAIFLTDEGKQTLRRIRATAEAHGRAFLAPLEEAERDALNALLLKLAAGQAAGADGDGGAAAGPRATGRG